MEYMFVNNELYHHGIKGQRWGIRRWQNEDGTFNEAGKKRYFNSSGSLSGNAHRALAKVYDINDKFYSKNGRNKTLASMNAAARTVQLKKAELADKAYVDKRKAKINDKYDKRLKKVEAERDKTLAAREANKAKLEARWKQKEAAGKLSKEQVRYKQKDFDIGTKAVKKGYNKYASTIKEYKNMKVSALSDPSNKKSSRYKAAGKAYRNQIFSDVYGGMSTTVLKYAGEAAVDYINKSK